MPLARGLPLVARGSALPTLFHPAHPDLACVCSVRLFPPREPDGPRRTVLCFCSSANCFACPNFSGFVLSLFQACPTFHQSLITSHQSLTPLESADPQNVALTLAESALPNLLDLKSFTIRTSKKIVGILVLWLTRHPMKDVCSERPSGVEGSLSNPMPIFLSAPLTMQQWLSILLHPATGTTYLFRQICGSFLTATGTSLARATFQ